MGSKFAPKVSDRSAQRTILLHPKTNSHSNALENQEWNARYGCELKRDQGDERALSYADRERSELINLVSSICWPPMDGPPGGWDETPRGTKIGVNQITICQTGRQGRRAPHTQRREPGGEARERPKASRSAIVGVAPT